MKQILVLSLFVIVGIFAACKQNNSFQIKGQIDIKGTENDSIQLVKLENDRLVTIATTVIKNGKFEFTGKVDTVSRYIVLFTKPGLGRAIVGNIFVENTKLSMHIDSLGIPMASGTPLNDTLRNYERIVYETKFKEMELIEAAKNQPVRIDSFTNVQNNLWINELNQTYAFIWRNINNHAGQLIFQRNMARLSLDQMAGIVAQANEATQKIPEIQTAKEMLKKRDETGPGNKYFDFETNDKDGKPFKLSEIIGKHQYILLDFWASWCGPCRKENPNLVKTYQSYKAKGLQIVGISIDKEEEHWRNAWKADKLPWPQLLDRDGGIAKKYFVQAIPHSVLIDESGVIVAVGLRGEDLNAKLEEVLKK